MTTKNRVIARVERDFELIATIFVSIHLNKAASHIANEIPPKLKFSFMLSMSDVVDSWQRWQITNRGDEKKSSQPYTFEKLFKKKL